MRQKVDGLMDITANTSGAFYAARAALNPPGAQDILDYDDTELTTLVSQLDYTVATAWTLSVGYMYEKYAFADAFTSGTSLMPQSVLIFMKADRGNYNANLGFAKLAYRF